eukprot:TRINITY_DN81849_c0_g1_i3.p1 TRINITY_DN81849_c0_g1~~TRINITY_DN81849_c0_g1_i3.p1  ORF type:complete len:929 (+),score=150.19 TRINITY_DN81849_c0_g1_i3:64-2850(+)
MVGERGAALRRADSLPPVSPLGLSGARQQQRPASHADFYPPEHSPDDRHFLPRLQHPNKAAPAPTTTVVAATPEALDLPLLNLWSTPPVRQHRPPAELRPVPVRRVEPSAPKQSPVITRSRAASRNSSGSPVHVHGSSPERRSTSTNPVTALLAALVEAEQAARSKLTMWENSRFTGLAFERLETGELLDRQHVSCLAYQPTTEWVATYEQLNRSALRAKEFAHRRLLLLGNAKNSEQLQASFRSLLDLNLEEASQRRIHESTESLSFTLLSGLHYVVLREYRVRETLEDEEMSSAAAMERACEAERECIEKRATLVERETRTRSGAEQSEDDSRLFLTQAEVIQRQEYTERTGTVRELEAVHTEWTRRNNKTLACYGTLLRWVEEEPVERRKVLRQEYREWRSLGIETSVRPATPVEDESIPIWQVMLQALTLESYHASFSDSLGKLAVLHNGELQRRAAILSEEVVERRGLDDFNSWSKDFVTLCHALVLEERAARKLLAQDYDRTTLRLERTAALMDQWYTGSHAIATLEAEQRATAVLRSARLRGILNDLDSLCSTEQETRKSIEAKQLWEVLEIWHGFANLTIACRTSLEEDLRRTVLLSEESLGRQAVEARVVQEAEDRLALEGQEQSARDAIEGLSDHGYAYVALEYQHHNGISALVALDHEWRSALSAQRSTEAMYLDTKPQVLFQFRGVAVPVPIAARTPNFDWLAAACGLCHFESTARAAVAVQEQVSRNELGLLWMGTATIAPLHQPDLLGIDDPFAPQLLAALHFKPDWTGGAASPVPTPLSAVITAPDVAVADWITLYAAKRDSLGTATTPGGEGPQQLLTFYDEVVDSDTDLLRQSLTSGIPSIDLATTAMRVSLGAARVYGDIFSGPRSHTRSGKTATINPTPVIHQWQSQSGSGSGEVPNTLGRNASVRTPP